LYPIQIIERNWINFLEKYLGKKLIHESIDQFILRLHKKKLALTLKKDMRSISNKITYYKFSQTKKENLIPLKKMIKVFNKQLTKYFSIDRVK
jgi:hypothetical protein